MLRPSSLPNDAENVLSQHRDGIDFTLLPTKMTMTTTTTTMTSQLDIHDHGIVGRKGELRL